MDISSFSEVQPTNAIRSTKSSYFLVKMPRDFDMNLLQKLPIDFSGENIAVKDEDKSYHLVAKKSISSTDAIFRPVINDETVGAAGIGPQFAGTIQVRQYFRTSERSSGPDPVPQEFGGYCHVEQLSDLKVRSMPRGSYTDIKSLHLRSSENRQKIKRQSEAVQVKSNALSEADKDKDKKKRKKKSADDNEPEVPRSKRTRQ